MSLLYYKELKPQKKQLRQQKLSDTRCASRHSSVNAICFTLLLLRQLIPTVMMASVLLKQEV